MTERIGVKWDVDFWSSRYPLHYLAVYNREIEGEPKKALRALWRWKSLNRANYSPDDVLQYLDDAEALCERIDGTVADAPITEVTDAFTELRSRLKKEDGPLSANSRAVVTPQFLLHLADSRNAYSGRFPILDVMVARAYRVHTAEDESGTLQDALTCSRDSYRRLTGYFFDNCETEEQVERLERALFVQGQAIGRYRANEGKYDEVRKVPVRVAREYLDEITRHTQSSTDGGLAW